MEKMKKTDANLVPDIVNPTPDYYCTWQTQLYATNGGTSTDQRAMMCEKGLFNEEKPYGWVNFYEKSRKDLIFVMDDSWDVPYNDDRDYLGSLILDAEKFPEATKGAKSNAEAMKNLADRIKAYGWKGVGGWVACQESEKFVGDQTPEEYWTERIVDAEKAGFTYWKVDWGKKNMDGEFRKMLTDIAKEKAPHLIVDHAQGKIVGSCDVFRIYDVPAVMSAPMTLQKLVDLNYAEKTEDGYMGLAACGDETYIGAAGGFALAIMRHPYVGSFVSGKADMAFPALHRDFKTKLYEVLRAVHFHRIAPAFGMNKSEFHVDSELLYDNWHFVDYSAEIEHFWLGPGAPMIWDYLKDDVLTKSGPARIARRIDLPEVTPDEKGIVPYIVASKNPNGVCAVATLGRTFERDYYFPLCDVTLNIGDADTVGVFGEYKNLLLATEKGAPCSVLMQDLADEVAYDITDAVSFADGKVVIPGELIHKIGTSAQPADDTSEPGAVIKLNYCK